MFVNVKSHKGNTMKNITLGIALFVGSGMRDDVAIPIVFVKIDQQFPIKTHKMP
jgi:hypothetical protein